MLGKSFRLTDCSNFVLYGFDVDVAFSSVDQSQADGLVFFNAGRHHSELIGDILLYIMQNVTDAIHSCRERSWSLRLFSIEHGTRLEENTLLRSVFPIVRRCTLRCLPSPKTGSHQAYVLVSTLRARFPWLFTLRSHHWGGIRKPSPSCPAVSANEFWCAIA